MNFNCSLRNSNRIESKTTWAAKCAWNCCCYDSLCCCCCWCCHVCCLPFAAVNTLCVVFEAQSHWCVQSLIYVCVQGAAGSGVVGQYLRGVLRNRGCSTNWATKTTPEAIIINKLNATIKQFRTARGNWKVINANNYAKCKRPKEISLCVNQLWTTMRCVLLRLSGEYRMSFSVQ